MFDNTFDDIFNADEISSAKNYEPKLPCVLVLDVSLSMKGDPIATLNNGLRQFRDLTMRGTKERNRVEIALVTFNHQAQIRHPFALPAQLDLPVLNAAGGTSITEGVRKAIELVQDRKQFYNDQGLNYYRPYIILMTDGRPEHDEPDKLLALKEDIAKGVDNNRYLFWAFGMNNADMDVLRDLSHSKIPPKFLRDANFAAFFEWLSKSIEIQLESSYDDQKDTYTDGALDENNIFDVLF